MEEVYKIITDFETYEVSNMGNVRNIKTKRILKPGISVHGYYYVNLSIAGKRVTKTIHRLVVEMHLENIDDKPFVDHVDNNRLNNNLINLRYVTNKENAQNAKLSIKNTSGSKGVFFHKKANKWCAGIMIDGIQIHLGCFESKEDAIQARIIRANLLFGVYTNACERI